MARLISVAAIALAASVASAAECSGKPDPNAPPNAFPINTDTTPIPGTVRTVKNGKAWMTGQPGFEFWVVHLYGSATEMGAAQGALFPAEARWVAEAVWGYMEAQIEGGLSGLPAWLADLIADIGLELALDVLADIERPSTPQHFYDELAGLANASGTDYKLLLRIHLIGELTQGDCSMLGAWGAATASGKALAFRALDWDTDIPAAQFPAVVVYHPEAGNGHAFANVGFLGWIGSMTGYSSARLSIHEIGVAFPDDTFGNESFVGIPFTFLLRDILQFDNSYLDSIARIQGANRTCNLILGVGDGNANAFRAFEYSSSDAIPMDDSNQMPVASWHPRIKDTTYYGMDWLCPGYSGRLAELINEYYGALDAPTLTQQVIPRLQSGDMHAAVYDLPNNVMYVSFEPTNSSTVPTPASASSRQFTRLDMAAMWAEPPPAL